MNTLEKDDKTISDYIKSIIKRTETFTEIEGIFINNYCMDGKKYINLNFIRNDSVEGIDEEINIPNVDNVILRIISIPSLNFNYGLMYERELKAANELLRGIIIKDRKDNYYTQYRKYIEALNIDTLSNNTTIKKIRKSN